MTIDCVGELGLCFRLTKEVNLEFLMVCGWMLGLPAVKRAGDCCTPDIELRGKGHWGKV